MAGSCVTTVAFVSWLRNLIGVVAQDDNAKGLHNKCDRVRMFGC